LSIDRRTPRAHLQSSSSGDDPETVPVSPALVEYLERKFPVRLSMERVQHPDGIMIDQARQMGNQEVIDLLRNLSKQDA
jgi:hypothetical protein